jgi:hypothetical protein
MGKARVYYFAGAEVIVPRAFQLYHREHCVGEATRKRTLHRSAAKERAELSRTKGEPREFGLGPKQSG